MKKLMGGLKGFKAKEFFLNHGEKLALGLVGVIVLLALSGTQWSRYDKTPQQILKKVDDAKNAIRASVWPETKRSEYALKDFAGDAQRVRGPLGVANYEYSTNLWWPLYRKQELAKEPELLAVLDLHASAGTFTLATAPAVPNDPLMMADAESAMPGSAAATPAVPADFDDQFSPVRGAPGAGLPPGATGMSPHGGPGGPGFTLGGPPPGAMPTTAHGGAGMGMEGFDTGMMSGMGGAPGLESRGERFVAVRGVWPLWQQLEKFQRALNLQTTNDSRNFLQLLDFVLERQTAVPGTDPWAGDWETVDIQRALDVLAEAYDYDIDRISPELIDTVITMPLPARVVGLWGNYATHPRIEKFTLPPAELQREMKLQEKLIEEYERYQLQEKGKTVRPKGFAAQQRNVRSMAQTMFESEYAGDFDNSMRGMMEQDTSVRMQLPDLKARLTAVGRLLLFRYMDFDVRPGYAYRYRVKLKLRNPNYEQPVDRVLEPSVAEGVERETPWSNVSNAAVVPQSVDYYLEDVERDPVNETKPTSPRPLARLDFFEWDATKGTMIRDKVEIKTYGQFLGETKTSLRLDVAKPSFKDEKVTFRSEDMLIDAMADVRIDPSMHPDLKLPGNLRGKAGLPAEAVVVDQAGELASLNPYKDQKRHSYLATYVQRERDPWESIKNKEAQPQSSMLDGGEYAGAANPYGAEMMNAEGGAPPPRRGKKRKPNPAEMGSSYMP